MKYRLITTLIAAGAFAVSFNAAATGFTGATSSPALSGGLVGATIKPPQPDTQAGLVFVGNGTNTFTVSCSSGNFEGKANVLVSFQKYKQGSELKYKVYQAYVGAYQITKKNGQKGGNKANVNLRLGDKWARSSDSMKQDGNWNSVSLTATKDMPLVTSYGLNNLRGYVQFIFDKSGSDPRCNAAYYSA